MRLLLQIIFRVKRYIVLLFITLFTLVGSTISDQMEAFSFGVLSDVGADFFLLFASKNDRGEQRDHVAFKEVEEKWNQIDRDHQGVITKDDARAFILQRSNANFLKRVMYYIKSKLHLEHNFKIFIILLCIVALNKAIFLFFSRYTMQKLAISVCRDLREQYFEHLQHQSMSFFQIYNIGTLSSRISNDAFQIAASVNSCIKNYIHAPFIIISTLIFCIYVSWQLSMVIFLGFPLILLPTILITRKIKRITRQLQRNQEHFLEVLIDFLSGIQTIKVFVMEIFSYKKYKERNDKMAKLEAKTAKYDLLTRPLLHVIKFACLTFVMVLGLYVLRMRLSELLVFIGLLLLFYEPVKKFLDEHANIQKGVVAAERMYEVLNARPQVFDHAFAVNLKEFKKAITFKDVWFRYEEAWILKELNFTIKRGESVAIVGRAGVGKSTIAQLIPRLYDVQCGEILIDDKPIQRYTQQSLREQIAFVPQKPFLFYDTIAANIAYGRSFSKEDIVAAAKKACAHEFIESLPQGYDALVAEMGKNFSGGQQQRLVIARALIKNAPILILDEATSSLDVVSEDNIKMVMKELHGEVTQILIAHRFSTLEYVDRIIYLEEGKKIAEGTRDELLENCASFRLLWEVHYREVVEPALR